MPAWKPKNFTFSFGIGDGDRDLVAGTARQEGRECVDEGHVAADRQAGCDADHVLFGDADVDVTVRIRPRETCRVRVDVARSASSIMMRSSRRAQGNDLIAEHVAQRYLARRHFYLNGAHQA